ncbi:MAG: hypothetical protein J7J75_01575 [Euryarchaeota archaeon]|nr:hypothetical protein [Euryarchaeota archaeon]MCD6158315.1 hypothetical protein [Euryarchaeota archaeon]HHC18849.1 hypothetical protein [Euryarchaeota archaeon]
MPLRSRIPAELVERFKALGFTKYEALAYLTLVVSGPLTASELSNEAGIPHSRVNDTIASLERRGFVEVNIGERKVFVALPPNIAFSRLINEVELLRDKVEDYQKGYVKEEKPFILHLRRTTDFPTFIDEILKRTSHEITIVLPDGAEHLLDVLSKNSAIDYITVVVVSKRPVSFSYTINYVVEDPGDNVLILSDAKNVLMMPYISYKYGGRTKVLGFYTNYKEVSWYVYSYIRKLAETAKDVRIHRTYTPKFACLFNAISFYKNASKRRVRAIIRRTTNGEIRTIIGDIISVQENFVNNITIKTEEGEEYVIGGLFSVVEDWEVLTVEFL